MTDPIKQTNTVREFYDSLAGDYDLMTEFPERFPRERPHFQALLDKFHFRTVLDAGAGTGFHSLVLAQLGVQVTAVDISPKMIAVLQDHAQKYGVEVRSFVSGFTEMPKVVGDTFDGVFCLGNSLAHAASREELVSWLRAFAKVLRHDGVLVLQNVNYDRILAERNRIQSTKDVGSKSFTRYYDFEGDRVIFNIRTAERTGSGINESVRKVSLLALKKSALIEALESAGFSDVETFGGMSLGGFEAGTSKDLVIFARNKRRHKTIH
jgi:2-polyprenyl-3-methyl-5-hydroxy-6-metoxy-1,4-benzoquinol methylase